ncbi:MAG: DUF1820 family protein [Acidobacteriota bacterium]|nr:DUF1820 family protein [Acidobacteriota bacterium]MDH3522175.1 DUF1820 family protein [Acidobacteriota bacterium]
MAEPTIYRVVFVNQGKVYEMYARSVGQSGIFGFIEVEGLLFGERTELVVDPSEESLKNEFKGVRRTNIPMHSIVRIDEVDKRGVSRITGKADKETTVMHFPAPAFDKPSGSGKS